MERNAWSRIDEGVRLCLQFVINYEDSVCHLYHMEEETIM